MLWAICVLIPPFGWLSWVAYLIFLRWLVKHTGSVGALRDAAIAARAFPRFGRGRP